MSSLILAILLSCVDGQTCNFQVEGQPIQVRLAEVAVPEMEAHCNREHHLARSARAFLTDALQRATRIELDVRSKDKNQTHAVVYADGKSVNQLLIQYDFAIPSTGDHDPMVWCPKGLSP